MRLCQAVDGAVQRAMTVGDTVYQGASAIKCCYAAAGSGSGAEETGLRAVPSIYSSARTELAKLLVYGLFRKIRVLAQDAVKPLRVTPAEPGVYL